MLKRYLHLLLVAVVAATLGLVATPNMAAADEGSVYTTPGTHFENDRFWQTDCEMYSSQIVRCSTNIWATTFVEHGNKFHNHDAWTFNNLTYLPAPREAWGDNPLANTGSWVGDDGRQWRTECDTANTGSNGCRTYARAHVVSAENGRHVVKHIEVLNNIVQFSNGSAAHQTTIPAATTKVVENAPVDTVFTPPANPNPIQSCGASYYGGKFQGRKTASGEIFDTNKLTAAHKTLPFGTIVEVTNPSNGKSVTVRINDRGPFISGRCLDLSTAAMQAVGGVSAGVITVNWQIVS